MKQTYEKRMALAIRRIRAGTKRGEKQTARFLALLAQTQVKIAQFSESVAAFKTHAD